MSVNRVLWPENRSPDELISPWEFITTWNYYLAVCSAPGEVYVALPGPVTYPDAQPGVERHGLYWVPNRDTIHVLLPVEYDRGHVAWMDNGHGAKRMQIRVHGGLDPGGWRLAYSETDDEEYDGYGMSMAYARIGEDAGDAGDAGAVAGQSTGVQKEG